MEMKPEITVRKLDEKTFGLFIGEYLLGTAKSDCDARFHMYFLEKQFKEVCDESTSTR
jgi:hypothetical protein